MAPTKTETKSTIEHDSVKSQINEQFYLSQQSLYYSTILKVNVGTGYKFKRVRIKIRRNSYDFQSHMRIELWNGDLWNVIISKPIEGSHCCGHSPYAQDPTNEAAAACFRRDALELLTEALEVISG